MRRTAAITLGLSFLALPAFGGVATDVPVRVDPNVQEDRPAASSTHLAWDQSKGERTDLVDVFVQPHGGVPTQVNPKNSDAFMGGLDGTRLVYEVHIRGGDGEIRLVDLATGAELPLPAGVNTSQEEWSPSIDGDYLSFMRAKFGRRGNRISTWLFRLSTGESWRLDTAKHREFFLLGPGHVNGNFVTWFRCGGKQDAPCYVKRYDAATGTTVTVPNPDSLFQAYGAPASDGSVYFIQSGFACGRNTVIMKWDGISPTATPLFAMAPKTDAISLFVDEGTPTREIHYVKLKCGGRRAPTTGDLYKIVE
jgi:hypothetical protein